MPRQTASTGRSASRAARSSASSLASRPRIDARRGGMRRLPVPGRVDVPATDEHERVERPDDAEAISSHRRRRSPTGGATPGTRPRPPRCRRTRPGRTAASRSHGPHDGLLVVGRDPDDGRGARGHVTSITPTPRVSGPGQHERGIEGSGRGRRIRARYGRAVTARLAGKVAVITGAGSGIGRVAAGLFASEGAAVVVADVVAQAARDTVEHIIDARRTRRGRRRRRLRRIPGGRCGDRRHADSSAACTSCSTMPGSSPATTAGSSTLPRRPGTAS